MKRCKRDSARIVAAAERGPRKRWFCGHLVCGCRFRQRRQNPCGSGKLVDGACIARFHGAAEAAAAMLPLACPRDWGNLRGSDLHYAETSTMAAPTLRPPTAPPGTP